MRRLGHIFARISRPLVLVALFAFFAAFTDTFWSPGNWGNVSNIVLQQAPFGILLAVCMTVSIVLNGFDLSLGASVALITCMSGILLHSGVGRWAVVALAVALGGLIGAINGILIAVIKVPAFVATYAMRWVLNGLALVALGGSQIYDLGTGFRELFISNPWTFFAIMAVIVLILSFVLNRTTFGCQVYATGMNAESARISGIRTRAITISVFVISGIVVGIVSVMYLANLGTAEPNIGGNFVINAIAATLVGGTAIGGGGNGKVSNAVIGALIMLVLTNGMIQIGVPSVWQQFVVGAVIILAIVMERALQKAAGSYGD